MKNEHYILKEQMTMDELVNALRDQAVRIVTMKINDWYVKGQAAVLVAFANGREFPFVRYRCIESGKNHSLWRYEEELFYRRNS